MKNNVYKKGVPIHKIPLSFNRYTTEFGIYGNRNTVDDFIKPRDVKTVMSFRKRIFGVIVKDKVYLDWNAHTTFSISEIASIGSCKGGRLC